MSQPVLTSDSATRPGTGRFPLVRTRPFVEESPWDVYRRVVVPHRPSVLLESGNPSSNLARWSFVAADPYMVFSGGPGHYTFETEHGTTHHRGDPLAALFGLLGPCLVPRSDSLPPFVGGAVGYASYDTVRHYETLPSMARRDLPLPDLEFLFFDLVVAIDHHTRLLHMIFTPAPERLLAESHEALYREGTARMDELDSRWDAPVPTSPRESPIKASSMEGTHSEREYVERVQQCQAYIGAGDIYQANLAQRFSVAFNPTEGRSLHAVGQNLYHRLRMR